MRRAIYNIRQALQQIFRNKGMSLASVFAITAMMLILGLFFIISVNVNVFTEVVRQDYDQVEVYLDDNVTESGAEQIMNTFKQTDGVSEVKYRSKEQAMQIMKERWGENGYLLNSLDSNPLPNSILVKVDNLKAANNINAIAKRTTGVESTKYYKETVDKLTKVTSFLQIAMLVIMIFLVAVSVVVVSNTIKLTV
ncbi:permease-like cell division protein FtsX, partial [uncultured Eubacterium sp.]|uniref:permease-like cell division protein FtsX n=1 Tax=uncultured Eubacterium sp. TaxID=165185 RepID=UPI00259203F3